MDKIICLGKNYQDHIIEMQEGKPERPVLFMKPPSCLIEVKDNTRVTLPWKRGLIHHECEVVFKLYKKNIIGLAIGLDLTLRDVQKDLKAKGHPWEIAKSFKNSAIVTSFHRIKDFPTNWQETPFTLKVNGEIRQNSSLNQAMLNPDEIIHYVDEFFPMRDGDIIMTGTPKGVGPLNPNDTIEMEYGPIKVSFQVVSDEF